MNRFTKLIILSAGLLMIMSCNSNPFMKNHKAGEDFNFSKSDDMTLAVDAMIEVSGIRHGGYVVIIPGEGDLNKKLAQPLQKEFLKQNLIAVHIFRFNPDSIIQKTDLLALENAGIICFAGSDLKERLQSDIFSRTKAAVDTAKVKNALVGFFNE